MSDIYSLGTCSSSTVRVCRYVSLDLISYPFNYELRYISTTRSISTADTSTGHPRCRYISARQQQPHQRCYTTATLIPFQPTTMNPAVQHNYILSTRALRNTTSRRKTSPQASTSHKQPSPRQMHTEIARRPTAQPLQLQVAPYSVHTTQSEKSLLL